MKHHLHTSVLTFAFLLTSVAIAQQQPGNAGGMNAANQAADAQDPKASSPAQLRIAAAVLQIREDPKKAQVYNDLALASVRRAREAADSAYFRDAEKALATATSLSPNDFQIEKTHVAILLGEQRFAEALKEATALNHHTPDDVTTYGHIAEADIALGDYNDAEGAAQWMLNLLPYNVPGLLLAAQLREIYGDPEGARECLDRAYAETSPDQTEELAWIANQLAVIAINAGQAERAAQALDQADRLFPSYPYTRENRASVQMAQGNSTQAVALLQELPRTPRLLYKLAKAEEAAGNSQASERTYADFEKAAKPLINSPDNANRELILYYSHQAQSSPDAARQALELAQHEIMVRHDVWTLDAYSQALYANGKYNEADVQIEKALAAGIRSDQLFDHAGHIADKLNKHDKAAQFFEAALQVHASPEYWKDARQHLANGQAATHSQSPAIMPPALSPPAVNEGAQHGEIEALPIPENLSKTELEPVPARLLTPLPTGTERIVRSMQHRVTLNPKDAGAYSGLGAAYLQRARETGGVENYQLAEQSLNKSLDLVSTDFSATAPLTTMAEVCMGEHRFSDALNYAQKALAMGSGDLSPFAIAGDAYADIGEYEKAGVAYARLLSDSDPRTAYARDSRLAYLKFVSGDTDGAIRLMQGAVTEGIEARLPSENQAWLYFELGEFKLQSGNLSGAADAYLAALTSHPGDYRALAGLARVRADRGMYQESILLYEKAIAVVPMPIYIAELGDIYAKLGNAAEAKKQYQLVQYIGLLGHINQVLHNRDLALFYADHDQNLSEALELARKEFEVRHDIYTWDALAWTLYKNGRYQESQDAIENALNLGTKDSLLLFHAGMIEAKLGKIAEAQKNFNRALTINPRFHIMYADQARQQLALFEKQPLQAAKGIVTDESHLQ